MTIDALLIFDPSGTSITTTAASTNVLDLGTQRDLGLGNPSLEVLINIQQAFTAAGAATLNVQIQSSVDNVTWSTLAESSAMPVASLTLGRQVLRIKLPADEPALTAGIGRYLRLYYVVSTGPFTAGQVMSALVPNREASVAYASGFNPAN